MYKIFIKKWILLFTICVFSLFIGLKNSIAFFVFFFWFLLSVVLVSFLWLIIGYLGSRLYLTRKVINKTEEDDALEVALEIKNNSFLPIFNLVILDNLTCAEASKRKESTLLNSFKPRFLTKIKYSCLCPLRGRYNLGPLQVYFFDPLGIFFLKKIKPVYSEVFVYPRTFNINKFPNLTKGVFPWFGIETARVSGDDDEFFGVREYRDGDPIKRIHWQSSARKSQLIVKQFQRQSFFRATIIFNLNKDDNLGEGKESVAEYTIKIVASLAKYLINMGASVEIIAHAGEIIHIPFNKGAEHLEDILRFLAVAQPESRVNLGEIFESFSRYLSDDSTLITVMVDKDAVYLPQMLSLQARNVSLIPIIILSSTFLPGFAKDKFKEMQGIEVKISGGVKLNPIYVCQGDNWQEVF